MQLLHAVINKLKVFTLNIDLLNGLIVDFCLDLLHTILLCFLLIFNPPWHIRDSCSKQCSEEEKEILNHESGDNKVQPGNVISFAKFPKLYRGENDEADAVDCASDRDQLKIVVPLANIHAAHRFTTFVELQNCVLLSLVLDQIAEDGDKRGRWEGRWE